MILFLLFCFCFLVLGFFVRWGFGVLWDGIVGLGLIGYGFDGWNEIRLFVLVFIF